MSPIIDLQRRLVEVGRIRLGKKGKSKGGKTIPTRLSTWRITTRDRARADAIAELYGGDVTPWEEREGEWEVITASDELPILVLPGQALTQWYEMWTQKAPFTCVRRCNGQTEMMSGSPCMCSEIPLDERKLSNGKSCDIHTRLSVILPDIPGIGMYRLDTGGYYAAVELAGVVAMLEEMTARGVLVPARLRIDQRRDVLVNAKGASENVTYPVPVVDVDLRAHDVLQVLGNGQPLAELQAEVAANVERNTLIREAGATDRELVVDTSYTPVPDGAKTVTVADGLRAVETNATPVKTSRSAAPLGPEVELEDDVPEPLTVLSGEGEDVVPVAGPSTAQVVEGPPSTTAADIDAEIAADMADAIEAAIEAEQAKTKEPEPEPEPIISDAQRTRLWTLVSTRKVPHERVREIVIEVTGEDSTKTIPKNLYDAVYASIQAEARGEE